MAYVDTELLISYLYLLVVLMPLLLAVELLSSFCVQGYR